MHITATHINLYHVCHRELWLHAHEIRMENTSDTVSEGKLIHETAYPQRAERYREVVLGGVKIDFYDPKAKVVHEIKKSDKVEAAHLAQVKYYLYVLEQNGIAGATGIIEYPTLRKTETVELTPADRAAIVIWLGEISRLLAQAQCPPLLNKPICKQCSYFDFCYVEE
ncbi:CRISPR-associated protein Cas4 [Adhaeribacter pallidiroseus]|uniref:CRISPR-associated exonuclease Cas4 n=1 Tax=Adhaeribacter pallidiroseus TaxID=2072847 RepID=A0A369QBL4_9BACT|nr:CRISPR-associated protein Cas4 [Adhaeribacter pallidiroseus]RDC62301.1 5' to 3' exodeoxyribonuclease (nucleoside 3'-phosphate-forming) [Adhaeribacter pallidiroseus]